MAEDPALYPGTSVLRNLRDIRDPRALQAFEASATAARIVALQERPISGSFDRAHLQAIHKYIFQDVYAWAGDLREVNIAKPGSPYFAAAQYLAPSLDELFAKLKDEQHLLGPDSDTFAMRAGYYLGEINAIHPFREGNGRAQQEFIRELAEPSGHLIDWSRVTREMVYRTSEVSFTQGDSTGLAAVVSIATVPQSDDRHAFVSGVRVLMRDTKTTVLPSAIEERPARKGAMITGRVIALDQRYVAIVTAPRAFTVLERPKLSREVALGETIKARVKETEIAIESRTFGQTRGRSR